MSRCVIVSAVPIKNLSKIKTFLKPDDYFIFCDGGLYNCKGLGVRPDLIVGDFDSFDKNKIGVLKEQSPEGEPGELGERSPEGAVPEIITLPAEKDDTDTFFAVKEGLKRGYKDFLLLGVIGNRFDHSLCNISALIYLKKHGASAVLIDDYSEMTIVGDGEKAEITESYSYFSLMNVAGDASGITIKNAKYPLENAELKSEYSYGISNEVLPGKVAEVAVTKGKMMLVKVW